LSSYSDQILNFGVQFTLFVIELATRPAPLSR